MPATNLKISEWKYRNAGASFEDAHAWASKKQNIMYGNLPMVWSEPRDMRPERVADLVPAFNRSDYISFVNTFADEAIIRAIHTHSDPFRDKTWGLIDAALAIAESYIRFSINTITAEDFEQAQAGDKLSLEKKLRSAYRMYFSATEFSFKSENGFYREQIHQPPLAHFEGLVGNYLSSEWRFSLGDRLIAYLLLQHEIVEYLRSQAIPAIFRNEGYSTLEIAFKNHNASGWGGLLLALRGMYMPSAQARSIVRLCSIGIDVMSKYKPGGQIATSELRRDVEELRAVGYVLPQTLYGFLDRLEAEGRMLI